MSTTRLKRCTKPLACGNLTRSLTCATMNHVAERAANTCDGNAAARDRCFRRRHGFFAPSGGSGISGALGCLGVFNHVAASRGRAVILRPKPEGCAGPIGGFDPAAPAHRPGLGVCPFQWPAPEGRRHCLDWHRHLCLEHRSAGLGHVPALRTLHRSASSPATN